MRHKIVCLKLACCEDELLYTSGRIFFPFNSRDMLQRTRQVRRGTRRINAVIDALDSVTAAPRNLSETIPLKADKVVPALIVGIAVSLAGWFVERVVMKLENTLASRRMDPHLPETKTVRARTQPIFRFVSKILKRAADAATVWINAAVIKKRL